MTPFEAAVVLLAIAIGTYLTNALLTWFIDFASDLNSRLLCSDPSTKPSAPSGLFLYIHQCSTRLISHYSPSSFTVAASTKGRGYLSALPLRQSSNKHNTSANLTSAPQEKKTLQPSTHLRALVLDLAATYPDHVYLGRSSFSGGNLSLCSRSRSVPTSNVCYNGEIAHVHPFDGCIHIILHPTDASLAASKGWAQRGTASGARYSYCTMSAPKNQAEWGVVKDVIKAAIWYARGKGGDGLLREAVEEEGTLWLADMKVEDIGY